MRLLCVGYISPSRPQVAAWAEEKRRRYGPQAAIVVHNGGTGAAWRSLAWIEPLVRGELQPVRITGWGEFWAAIEQLRRGKTK
jgi:hypothetical protein